MTPGIHRHSNPLMLRNDGRYRALLVLAVAWVLVAVVIYVDTAAVRSHLEMVEKRGLRGQGTSSTPMSAAYLPGAIDGLMWARHAQSVLSGTSARVRHTTADNAPQGREVHWSSLWTWSIAAATSVRSALTDDDMAISLEKVGVWLSPMFLLVAIVVLSSFVARQGGALLGCFTAVALLGTDHFATGFAPSYLDHNGLVNLCVAGTVLGALFAATGFARWPDAPDNAVAPQTRAARVAIIFSAICGAIGLWVSAAATIPVIGATSVAALVSARVTRTGTHRISFHADVWRIWGRIGAVGALLAYLIEYFPAHMGMRLEVNHPAYAIAWFGTGELIAEISRRWSNPAIAKPVPLLPYALMIALPVLVVMGAGSAVFSILDPFLKTLHGEFIQEFMPVWTMDGAFTANPYASIIGIENLPLMVGLAVLATQRRRAPTSVWFMATVTVLLTALAWYQMRWLAVAAGAQVALAVALLEHFIAPRRGRPQLAFVVATAAVLYLPSVAGRVSGASIQSEPASRPEDIFMLDRDIAAALRRSQPAGEITVLSSPNASPVIAYYGQFSTVGTLYWENGAGLKAAAAILTATSPDDAARLIRERGITHIALTSAADFLSQYFALAYPGRDPRLVEQTFGYQLLYGDWIPAWLQVIPYAAPPDLQGIGVRVALFRVAFDQSEEDANYHAAVAAATRGDFQRAGDLFDQLVSRESSRSRGWLGKAGVLLATQSWTAATEAALQGISRADTAERRALTERMSARLISEGQHAHAVRLHRELLRVRFDPDVACALAYLLSLDGNATSPGGSEAVSLAERAARDRPQSAVHHICLGAALAQNGRLAEAERTAARAVGLARASGDREAEQAATAMAARFRARLPQQGR